MTFEELMDSTPPVQQHALVKGYQAGFAAGAASRDAEVLRLKNELEDVIDCKYGEGPTALASVIIERDKLHEQVKMLRDAVQHMIDEAKLTSNQYELCRQALAATEGEK